MAQSQDIDAKQKLLIEFLICDKETFVKCYNILKPEYFSSPLDDVIEFILGHFQKHSGIPSVDLIDAESGIELEQRTLDPSERSYLLEEIETLCQDAAMENAILEAADHVSNGDRHSAHDLVKDALMVKIDKTTGINLFEEPKERIERIDENVVSYSCGIGSIDGLMGRFRSKEFYMVYAVTGGGKSLFLGNTATAFSRQGLDVAVITLELQEELYAKRLDSMMTGVDIEGHKQFAQDISDYYENQTEGYGSVQIKRMNAGATSSEIEAYLLEYKLEKEKHPDVLIVDYIGIMGVNGMKGENKFDIDDQKAMGLMRMAGEYDMMVFSAGQINREGYGVMDVNPSHCAGGLSLINNSDGAFALVANEEDLDNDQMQATALKVRHTGHQVGNTTLYRNPKTLEFSDEPFTTKKATSPVTERKKSQGNDDEEKEAKSDKKQSGSGGKKKLRDALNH